MSLATLTSSIGHKARRQAGWVGIDIGSHSIKLVRLQLVQGKKQVAEAAILPLPHDARLTPESVRAGWLKQTLQQLSGQVCNFCGQSAACGLSPSVTEFRALSIPPGSRQERREMISLELAEDQSGPSGDREFDFWSGESNPADPTGQNAVNLLAVSRSLVHEVAEALYQSNLCCEVLDGGPFILARAASLDARMNHNDHPMAVLDWGHAEAQFVVAANGQPAFTRILKGCNLHDLMAAVACGLQLSPQECEQVLLKYGFSDTSSSAATSPLQDQLFELADPFLHRLQIELGKTFAYLKHQRPHLMPEQICLTGGAASIRHIAARLTTDSEIPFSVWNMARQPTAIAQDQPLGVLAQAAALSDLGWAA